MVSRADGLDGFIAGLPREWIDAISNSAENADGQQVFIQASDPDTAASDGDVWIETVA